MDQKEKKKSKDKKIKVIIKRVMIELSKVVNGLAINYVNMQTTAY